MVRLYVLLRKTTALSTSISLTPIFLIVGMTGIIQYNKCFEGCYAFLLIMLSILHCLTAYAAKNTIGNGYDRLEKYFNSEYEDMRLVVVDSLGEANVLDFEPTVCECWRSKARKSKYPVCDNATFIYVFYNKGLNDYTCNWFIKGNDTVYRDVGFKNLMKELLTDEYRHKLSAYTISSAVLLSAFAIFMALFTIFVDDENQFSSSF